MLLYQPISRTFGQRDGCLTPASDSKGHIVKVPPIDHILLPPMLPYRPSEPEHFAIEHRNYTLTLTPWRSLKNYRSRHLKFLQQYHTTVEKIPRKKRLRTEDSDSDIERVRTRRVVKEHSVSLDERAPLPSPKKKRKEMPIAAQQAALIDETIPDYLPDPNATLPAGNPRVLKIEWKGQPMDLRFDTMVGQLHPAEVVLALTLRLPAKVYLDLKRRLFAEKVNRLRAGMPFRRTDAQKACRVDVNKASRLFAAFEKVGWLEDEHFVKYI